MNTLIYQMPFFTDQTGRTVSVASANRIVSLVPSQTELLHDLGLGEKVAGITKFCVHPDEWFRTKTRVGGTKQLKQDVIRELHPDLILANKEENSKEQIEELATDYPVWISDIHNLDDACEMITEIGRITRTGPAAQKIVSGIRENFSGLNAQNSKSLVPDKLLLKSSGRRARLKSAYLIWQKPYMTAGGDTFIHAMLEAAGFENMFAGRTRYPETSIEELRDAGCECLLLSSEPFPFKQQHLQELQQQLPGSKILLVDGEMFSWYGSRLLQAPGYFISLQREISTTITG